MNGHSNKLILAQTAAENFIGRAREIETLMRHANVETDSMRGLLVLSAPGAGTSELLRQVYDRIFTEQQIIPFYFAFSPNDKTPHDCAIRFLQTFLLQAVAFRRQDENLLNISPDICEINDLAAPPDAHWIHQLTKICQKETELNDERSFLRQVLSSPLRAAANAAPVIILLDDLQDAPPALLEELKEIYIHSTVPFVLAGRRRFVLRAMQNGGSKLDDAQILRLNNLSETDAELLIEKLAKSFDVEITEQTRDLIVRQFDSSPLFIKTVLQAAHEQGKNLQSFQAVEQIYVRELFGGRIGRRLDNIFTEIESDSETRKQIVKLLHEGFNAESGKVAVEDWKEQLSLNTKNFERILQSLHIEEIINLDSGTIRFSSERGVLKDYSEARYRLEIADESRASVIAGTLKNSLKRAPQMMNRSYRRATAIGLRELMSVFNCQKISENLFDYGAFKKSNENLNGETPFIQLPQIIYTAHAAAFYPPIAKVAEAERCAVAEGFETAEYSQENETVWIAAEIDSKLEAAGELAEFWCDRLEALAVMCNFSKYQLWLVAPEGFAPEAIEILRARNAYGSSRKQVELLIKHLKAENIVRKKSPVNEYELVLPMGDDTELIAANAVEEIARRHHFPPKDITKIKTALVEACINAAEHSLSPDQKIYQKISVDDDRIVITISNRGIKLPAAKIAESTAPIEPDEGRRGWGLKLMRTLMDEVNFEQVDDGTRISMVKFRNS